MNRLCRNYLNKNLKGLFVSRYVSTSARRGSYKYVNAAHDKLTTRNIVDENANALFGTELLRGFVSVVREKIKCVHNLNS